MLTKRSVSSFYKILLAAALAVCDAEVLLSRDETAVILDRKYEESVLHDVSSDGQLLLFSRHTRHMQTFSVAPDGRARENQPAKDFASQLAVVEINSGREVGQTKVDFFPTEEQFVPESSTVFYKERADNGHQFTLWNFVTGE